MVYRDGEPVLGNFPEPDIIFSAIAQKMFDAIHPVGEQYVQYPSIPDMGGVQRNTVDPMTLYNVNGVTSTWVELNFDGAFFRANGGFAENFGSQSVPQSAQLPNITGAIGATKDVASSTQYFTDSSASNSQLTEGALYMTTSGRSEAGIDNGTASTGRLDQIRFDASRSDSIYTDGGEVRPPNYTVKIWQRTA